MGFAWQFIQCLIFGRRSRRRVRKCGWCIRPHCRHYHKSWYIPLPAHSCRWCQRHRPPTSALDQQPPLMLGGGKKMAAIVAAPRANEFTAIADLFVGLRKEQQ